MINMLYKKYHRKFVRQFKKGTKFWWSSGRSSYTIGEPNSNYTLSNISVMTDSGIRALLVFSNGSINRDMM